MIDRPRFLWPTLLITSWMLFALGAVGAAEPHEGDATDVVTIDRLDPHGPYNKIWEPYIAKWKENHFLVCYGLQVRRKLDMGDIVCSITRDGGKTWSPRITVFDHRHRNGTVQYAYNNSVLYRPPGSDVVWLFVMRAPMNYRDSENADLVAAYTSDGGYSWNHVEVAMGYQGPLIIVAGIESVLRDGVTHYLLPAHRNSQRHDPFGDRRQFVLESTSLVHWRLASYVPLAKGDDIFLHEGGLAPSPSGFAGELKMVMRTADTVRERPLDPPVAYSTVSQDGGKTWSTARPEPDLPNYRAKSFYGRDASGRYLYIYNDQVARHGLYYKVRRGNEKWSEEKTFYFNQNRNTYPTLIEDAPNKWIAVWDSSDDLQRTRTRICFGRLEL